MADLGMPRGHVLKLRRRLRGLRGDVEAKAPQTAPPTRAPPSPEKPIVDRAITPAVGRSDHSNPTGSQVSAVQRSWEVVKSLGSDHVGWMLYRNLFEMAPETMELFPREVRARYQTWTMDEASGEGDIQNSPALSILFGKVVSAVGFSVSGMHDTEQLMPKLRLLGMRHINYRGVSPAHYPVLQTALIKTLRQCIGDEVFTPEVEFAWKMVYNFIAAMMCEGLREAMEMKARAERDGVEVPWDRRESGELVALTATSTSVDFEALARA